MKHLVASVVLLAACGSKEGEKKNPPAETKVEDKKPDEKKPEAKKVAAPVDPATFVAIDLSSVPELAGHTIKAPPGATVTADDPDFNENKPKGAVLAKDDFALHLWWSTTGGERTIKPMQTDFKDAGVYTETTCNPDICEYTTDVLGTKRHGFFRPVDRRSGDDLNRKDGQLLCGPLNEVATPEALAPYRAACDSVARKK